MISEGRCRVCKTGKRDVKLDAAHTINRKDQDEWEKVYVHAKIEEDRKAIYRDYSEPIKIIRRVPAAAVVPLCQNCHLAYDAHKLDLLPYLTNEEQASAVAAVGIVRAVRRLTGEVVQIVDTRDTEEVIV